MDYYARVCCFIEEIKSIRAEAELADLLSSILRDFGFRYYAVVNHVDLAAPPAGSVRLTNYPESWRKRSSSHLYYADDPVLMTAQKLSLPFTWDDIPQYLQLTPRQKTILAEARAAGLTHGYTVPIHIPGQVSGSCSFVYDDGEIDPACFPAAHYVGIYAFNAALRLARPEAFNCPSPTRLTDRQKQCLALAARGKSDWSIGQLLRLSQQTVHMHIENAKKRYGVASRVEAVVRALFDGELAFADVFRAEDTSQLQSA